MEMIKIKSQIGGLLIALLLIIIGIGQPIIGDENDISYSIKEHKEDSNHEKQLPSGVRASDWSFDTVDTYGEYTSMVLDSNDRPHISYIDYHNSKLKYAYFDGNRWQTEIVDNVGSMYNTTTLALDTNDRPHITYCTGPSHDLSLKYAHYNNSWNITVLDTNVDSASLSLDLNGRPHITYCIGDFPTRNLKYTHWNDIAWQNETLESVGDVGGYTSIVVDSNDRPHIAYSSGAWDNIKLKYAYYDGNSWHNETADAEGGAGAHSSIALDSNDRPHISYRRRWPGNDLKYTYYDGIVWNNETVDSESNVDAHTSIAIDSHDRPHIAYSDYNPEFDLKYAYWDGGAWNNETVDSESFVVESLSLVIDDDERVHICYTDNSDWPNRWLKYAYNNPPNDWTILSVDDRYGEYSSIAMDSSNRPHITYYNGSDNKLKYTYYDGAQWHTETVDSVDYTYNTSVIALDSNDRPHISYCTGEWENSYLKYAYYDGNNWNITSLGIKTYFSTSIALDSNDRPHISCCVGEWPEADLKHVYWDGLSWQNETIDSESCVGMWSSIAVDLNDNVHISYQDGGDNDDLKYAYYDGNSWSVETVDEQGIVGAFTSVSLDSANRPHISYYDGLPNRDLKYAYNNGDTWIIETVDSDGYTGEHTSIAVDSNDRPHIAYYDYWPNYYLKYAFWNGSAWQKETVDLKEHVYQFVSLALDLSNSPHISYYANSGLKYAFKDIVQDNESPRSSVDPISPYWREVVPFEITVTARDNLSIIKNVELWYRFSTDNSTWSEWRLFAINYLPPWSYEFTFPNGSGNYEFYSVANDAQGNRESASVFKDAECGYSAIRPRSWANFIYPYWTNSESLNITVNAVPGNAAVRDVALWYRFSLDNKSWGDWSPYGLNDSSPWIFEFHFREGNGHYRFYSVANDTDGNMEQSPRLNYTKCAYDNILPVADAGPDRTVNQKDRVQFTGSGSTDNNGLVRYSWTFNYEGLITLYGVSPGYTFLNAGNFPITLKVTDVAGNQATDSIIVTVIDITKPLAYAGGNRTVVQGNTVTFDGSGSTDNVAVTNYTWSLDDEGKQFRYGITAQYTFTRAGNYTVSLIISDNAGNQDTDTFIVKVVESDKILPIARAGRDVTILQGGTAYFNGNESYDNVGIINYTWSVFYNEDVHFLRGVKNSFKFEKTGNFTVRLTVTDAAGLKDMDDLIVTVLEEDPNEPPAVQNDSDSDGWTDAEEKEAGSDPNDPNSTPLDWDGDGVANENDAYPRDSTRWIKEKSSNRLRIVLYLGLFFVLILGGLFIYSRIKGREILGNKTRKRILVYIEKNPGKHYSEMKRELDISRGTLTYHLGKLDKGKMISSTNGGKFRYFYPTNAQKNPFNLTPAERRMIEIIRKRPGSSAKEVANEYGTSIRTVYYHLGNLSIKGIVNSKKMNGNQVWFTVSDHGVIK